LFIPNKGQHDHYLLISDIRLVERGKVGREIIVEFSTCAVRVTGRNLRAGAGAIVNRLCGSVEAF
jgi:hypothetical protein